MAGEKKFDFQMNNVVPGMPRWVANIRFFQIFASILVMILTAYSLSYYGSYWGGGSLGFAIFTCIWSLIFTLSVVLFPIILPFLYFKWLALLAECLTWIFWLGAWACLANWSASFNGSWDGYGYHGAAWGCVTVAAVFGAFAWITFCVTLFTFSVALHRYRIDSNDVEMTAQENAAPAQPAAAEAPTNVPV